MSELSLVYMPLPIIRALIRLVKRKGEKTEKGYVESEKMHEKKGKDVNERIKMKVADN